MFCKNCGKELADGTKFCSSCGSSISHAEKTTDAQAPTTSKAPTPKKNSKKILSIAIAVIVIIFICSLFGGKSAEKTAKEFVENMLDGDAKGCVALLTDDAVEQTGSATRKILINVMDDALAGLIEEYESKYGSKWKYEVTVVDSYEYDEYEYYSGDYIGEAVKVVLEITHSGKGLFNDKKGRETETLILVKEGNKWLVSGFSF